MTQTEIYTVVKTKIRADLASPTVNNLNDASISQWANEAAKKLVHELDPAHCKDLQVINEALAGLADASTHLTFTRPATLEREIAVRVTGASVSNKFTRIIAAAEFWRFDASNAILSASEYQPIAMVADKVYVKPTTVTSARIDYIKAHPTIGASQATLFDDYGDNLLILLIMSEYYTFSNMPELAARYLAEYRGHYGN